MKIAIVGSRKFQPIDLVDDVVELVGPCTVVSGGAHGVDKRAEMIARELKYPEPVVIKPDWKTHGKKAGHLRNSDIVDAADIVVAFWDGSSRGTNDSIRKAKRAKKPLLVITSRDGELRTTYDGFTSDNFYIQTRLVAGIEYR